MPQFVILLHTLPPASTRASHYDFMLEHEGQLLTWALASLPSPAPQRAEALPAHRLAYLDYEGPVSNDRGEVRRQDHGMFQWQELQPDQVKVRLQGVLCQGVLTLRRVVDQFWEASLESTEGTA